MVKSTRLAALFVAVFCMNGRMPAQERAATKKPPKASTALQAVHDFREVSISPDGHAVAWLGDGADGAAAQGIYVSELGSPVKPARRVTAGDGKAFHGEHALAWSPDGRQIAFLSDAAAKGQQQIYVVRADSGAAKKLTNLKGAVSELRWSPDAKQIGFLFIENPPRAAGPTASVPPETGVVGETVFEQRLGAVEVAAGKTRTLTPADLYVYEYAWSPDGKNIAAIAAHGSGDNNWYVAQLYTLAVASGEMKSILKTLMQIAVPCWSPDGKAIAIIGGLMSDEGVIGGEIYSVPATGGVPRNLTPEIHSSPCWLTWPQSGQIVFSEHVDGGSGIGAVDPSTGHLTRLWSGGESIAAEGRNRISITRDGKGSALVRQSFHQPPEIWSGPIGAWKQLTHANKHAPQKWGSAESLHWKSDDFTVQGWLLHPTDFKKDRRYPMVVVVHGGPASQVQPSFPSGFFDVSRLSRAGYFVFLPNPRGSYGQGEKFTRANVKDFGYGDLRDILSGVDEVLKRSPVDRDRLGVTGWSYGGYMTMWAVTQTTRFRAAVAGAGIANWQSYYGQNGIDQWLIPYFGASVYDDPAVYARSSPINFIKQVKTPTLVLVGEYDVECPLPQSYEFWHALRTLDVPTKLVVYPKEGHGIRQPEHQRDIMKRMLGWFDKYLQNGTTSAAGH
ncbi:MAG TPA: S9 family peptidase [Gemmataceae bacterium]|jgi:dipeptidyl aminopeptidase/acylaminoacyl peptidase|nr:S9 family peptidase [Gemmataceae bacterium]